MDLCLSCRMCKKSTTQFVTLGHRAVPAVVLHTLCFAVCLPVQHTDVCLLLRLLIGAVNQLWYPDDATSWQRGTIAGPASPARRLIAHDWLTNILGSSDVCLGLHRICFSSGNT